MLPPLPIVLTDLRPVAVQMSQPISIRNHRPASLAFLRLTPRHGVAARVQDDFSLVAANDFRFAGPVLEDYEVMRLSWVRAQPWGKDADWWFEVPLVSRSGGVLDGVIDWFHNEVLGSRNSFRDEAPKNRHAMRLPGSTFGPGAGIGDVSIGASKKIARNTTARTALEIPTGDASRLLGSGGFDFSVGLDHRWQVNSRWAVHFMGALTAQGRASHLDSARGLVEQAAIGVSFATNSRDTYLMQWNSEASPTVTGIPNMDATHRTFSFGYRRYVGDGLAITFSISEDRDFGPTNFNGGAQIGPDLTFAIQLSRIRM